MALVHERDRRLRRRIDRAKDLMLAEAAVAGPRREPIPEDVRREVFRRDGGRCAVCGEDEPAPVRPRDPGGAWAGPRPPRTSSCCARRATATRAPPSRERRGGPGRRDPGVDARPRRPAARDRAGGPRRRGRPHPGRRPQHPGSPALRGDRPAPDAARAAGRRARGLRGRPARLVRREPAALRRPPGDRRRRDRPGGAPPVRHPPGLGPVPGRRPGAAGAHRRVDPDLPPGPGSATWARRRTAWARRCSPTWARGSASWRA